MKTTGFIGPIIFVVLLGMIIWTMCNYTYGG